MEHYTNNSNAAQYLLERYASDIAQYPRDGISIICVFIFGPKTTLIRI